MPSVSKKQQRFMGKEYADKKAGKKGKTKMSKESLKDFASTKHKGLPMKKAGPPTRTRKVHS